MPRTKAPEAAQCELKSVDFKAAFDPERPGDWCELIKDIVAMANSGGGAIVVGLTNDGTPSGWDPTPLLAFDHAKVVDKIASYTDQQYAEFEVREGVKSDKRLAVIDIRGVAVPMVFVRPGTYEDPNGTKKQQTAFGRGTLYFRHGTKSEPATAQDLPSLFHRERELARKELLANVRKLAYVPAGYRVTFVPGKVADPTDVTATPIRLVDDPTAPVVRGLDPNKTHPYRPSEVVLKLNERLKGRKINAYDIKCIKKIHKVDETKRHFFYKPRFGAAQYSDAFVTWIVKEYEKAPRFFEKCRGAYRRLPRDER